ncbi:MAG: hypothetical protein O210_OD1C00001G0713 [Parcubacteria bacterium RAAC4_OD1_1]|nr:MAG: hypothetical protein O210_OD1C00001G0713 [Parcubacteria bacterium RAAC4_OD1_1]
MLNKYIKYYYLYLVKKQDNLKVGVGVNRIIINQNKVVCFSKQ